jgi:hypothetical protein
MRLLKVPTPVYIVTDTPTPLAPSGRSYYKKGGRLTLIKHLS